MQVEEVIHSSRLYSILVRERLGDRTDEDGDLFSSPWTRHGFLSEFKSVQRTLSRKFSTLRRKRKKEDGPYFDKHCDNEPSAIDAGASCIRTEEPARVTRNRNSSHNSNCSLVANNCTGGKSLSRIFGSFRQSFRQGRGEKSDEHENTAKDGTKLTADQSHEEIISGRDSAYFSLTFTSASESENEESHSKICDEHRASFKSALTPPPIATSTLIKKDKGCQTEPKKNVTLLLPDTRSPSKPFGVHLQTQTVKIRPPLHDTRYLPDGDSSWQMDTIFQVAKVHLVSNFPKFNLSINIIFTPSRKHFTSLSSSTIGNLMFDLNRILFSPQLPHIVTWEVSLFTIIKFLCHLVSYLTVSTGLCLDLDISCVKYFHNCLIKDFTDYRTEKILTKVQQEFIQIWMCLLLE